MRTWRILENKHGRPHTLFHGLDGSRTLPLDIELEACTKMVRNAKGQTPFKGGFHTLEKESDVREYLTRFNAPRPGTLVVCAVDVHDTWPKPTNDLIILSRFMTINSEDWQEAIA